MTILGDSRIHVAREGTSARAMVKVVVIKDLGQHQVILSLQTLKRTMRVKGKSPPKMIERRGNSWM